MSIVIVTFPAALKVSEEALLKEQKMEAVLEDRVKRKWRKIIKKFHGSREPSKK